MNRRLAESYCVVTRTGGLGFTRWEPSPFAILPYSPDADADRDSCSNAAEGSENRPPARLFFYLIMLGEGLTADGH